MGDLVSLAGTGQSTQRGPLCLWVRWGYLRPGISGNALLPVPDTCPCVYSPGPSRAEPFSNTVIHPAL